MPVDCRHLGWGVKLHLLQTNADEWETSTGRPILEATPKRETTLKPAIQLRAVRSSQPIQGQVSVTSETSDCGHRPHVSGEIVETIPGIWARYVISDDGDVVLAGEGPFK